MPYRSLMCNSRIHCAELYLFDEMNCRTTTASMAIMNLTGNSSSSSPDSEVVRDIVASYRLLWNDFADVPLDVNWLSPKLRALIDVISENHTPALQAIVFVQQRQVAYCLARVMNMIPALQDKVKCDALTGGNESSFSLSTDWKQVIDSFRRKELNLRKGSVFALTVFFSEPLRTNSVRNVSGRGRPRFSGACCQSSMLMKMLSVLNSHAILLSASTN